MYEGFHILPDAISELERLNIDPQIHHDGKSYTYVQYLEKVNSSACIHNATSPSKVDQQPSTQQPRSPMSDLDSDLDISSTQFTPCDNSTLVKQLINTNAVDDSRIQASDNTNVDLVKNNLNFSSDHTQTFQINLLESSVQTNNSPMTSSMVQTDERGNPKATDCNTQTEQVKSVETTVQTDSISVQAPNHKNENEDWKIAIRELENKFM